VRRAGKLTFADVQRLLEPVGSAAPDISRLDIDYRLDSGIDHWLLDEFQDTSFGQWRVLANLVDEAIQDPRRSFFCVGDVKQSIFGWREGDSRLFGEILAHYNAASPGTIVEDRLVRSWRSGPPLLEMVNAVFGNPAAMSALFPQPAVSRWAGEWRTHASAVPGRTGQAALLHAADRDGRWARTLDLLREIRPLERGLTCAILVQKNETAAHLADHLRREGAIPAVAESDLRVCTDNPLGAAILALFRAAAHPGDGMAWEHVRMTPLREILETEGLGTPSALSARILGEVHAAGFERAVEGWLRRAGARLGPTDSFSRERARQFAEAAGIFDLSGGRDIDEFLEFMDQHVVRDTEGAGSVRIMTIHKSKGLGFDVVLLPDLEGKTLMALDRGLSVKRAADRSVQWVLDRPNALFCSADPVLAGFVGDAQADACFERLCVLYVALTRAKRAMYAIVEPRPDSDSRNYPRFLAETLGCGTKEIRVGSLALEGAWSAGDPDWAGAVPEKTQGPPAVPRIVPLDRGRAPRVVRLPARVPSSQRVGSVAADRLFSLDSAAEFGAAVHALLARVEWWDGAGDPLGKGVSGPAADEARSCIRAPEHADAWIRSTAPGSVSEVWRERPFEGVIDGAWVTGRFDRVVVNRSPSGDPISAVVYDFKTGRLEPDADSSVEGSRHADQLAIYRRAAAALTGLPLSAVRGELIRTRPPGETDQGTS
jgi:ATP-dependent helicase/nuclease subunit A